MKTKWVSAPYLVWMTVFIAVPLLMIAVFAFTTNDGEFTVKNIQDVGQYANIFFRSIWLSVIATAICLVVAYPVSFILSRMEKHKQATMLMIVMLPMWMNFLLRTYAWMTLLGNNGVINHLLGLIGIGPLKLINTSGAVVLGMVYNYLPFMILPLYSVMVKIDKSVIEAAHDLGCNNVPWLQRSGNSLPCDSSPEPSRNNLGRYHGVRACHLHIYHFKNAWRRFKSAHRRPYRDAVLGKCLQSSSGSCHFSRSYGHYPCYYDCYESVQP